MNCPVCKRELAPTLSICFTCGAMVNDSVREELESKIARPAVPQMTKAEIPKFEPIKPWTPQPVKVQELVAVVEPPSVRPEPVISAAPISVSPPALVKMSIDKPASLEPVKPKVITSKLKKDTSPTLVEFQPTNPAVPDWRLQLQNAIRKRNQEPGVETPSAAPAAAVANSVSVAPAARSQPVAAAHAIQNEKLANAIKRIEASKRTFGSGAAVGMAAAAQARARKPVAAQKAFPFDVVERTQTVEMPTAPAIPAAELPKPKLVAPIPPVREKFDTNKLPPIPEPEVQLEATENGETSGTPTEARTKINFDKLRFWAASETIQAEDSEQESSDEIDDLAPFSMRFGAAVFDLIIGTFAAGVLLSPLLLSSTLGSTASLFAIFGGWLFVMFAYFTGSIVYLGRTFGMKLFSIEMIDAEANEVPTFHQAAVHSAVYLLSLMLFGLGFVPAFFNEERRAMHDLLAGTLLIREY